MEFDTFVRHNLPVAALISNDRSWGMVKHWQCIDYGKDRCVGTKLMPRQRYDKMVEALGGYGEYVTNIEDTKLALSRAFSSGLPAYVNMAQANNPYENAMMESFFKPLNHEEVNLCEYETIWDVVAMLTHIIEEVCNQKRLYSALGYRPLNEF